MILICSKSTVQELPAVLDPSPMINSAPALIDWFSHNARVLPWRVLDEKKRPDPYRVWISEIMLQQTRVEAVKGYFARFTERLPDVQALAEIPEDQLLKLWEGLGYYSRARNLQKAAKVLMEQYDGRLPDNAKELLKLPGIGDYTSGAIASIAYRESVPAVDGNVLRVVSRILDSHMDITKPDTKAEISHVLQEVFASVPDAEKRPDLFNQSLMELGATVCVPNGAPQCLGCPVSRFCQGYQKGTAPDLPVKEPKKARRIEEKTVLLLHFEGMTALHKRPEKGMLAGMWELPNLDGHLDPEEALAAFDIPSGHLEKAVSLGNAKHIFTHIEWEMTGWELTLSDISDCPKDWLWKSPQEIHSEYPIPSALKAYSKQI